jgi:hypothetical protein
MKRPSFQKSVIFAATIKTQVHFIDLKQGTQTEGETLGTTGLLLKVETWGATTFLITTLNIKTLC